MKFARTKFNLRLASGLLLTSGLLIGTAMQFITPVAHAAGETISVASGTVSVEPGAVSDVDGLEVSGASGTDSVSLRMEVPSGNLEMTTTTGLTFTGASSGTLLRFTGTINNVNAALDTLQYTSNGIGEFKLAITLIEAAYFYNPGNHHVYQSVASDTSTDSWSEAKAAAEGLSFGGVNGYLATLTTGSENTFATERFTNGGWIGASDADSEGDWRWVTGPEGQANGATGTAFWSGNGSGSVVADQYANWNSIEPNNSLGNEDCAQALTAADGGKWNDLPCGNSQQYFIVEYGAGNNNPAVEYKEVMLQAEPEVVNVASCEELVDLANGYDYYYDTINLTADIDCSDIDLRYSDSVFAKTTDYPYRGTFNGNGHSISNVALTAEGGPLGLFGSTDDASFNNLTLRNFDNGAGGQVGGLVGYAKNTTFEDITLDNVKASYGQNVGALVGYVERTAAIENVHATNSTVEGSGSLGGLIGSLLVDNSDDSSSSVVRNASFSGNISATWGTPSNVGGLIGRAEVGNNGNSLLIEQVYADATMTEAPDGGTFNDDIGGLIGKLESFGNASATLCDAYSWSDISATYSSSENVGGLVGRVAMDGGEESSMTITRTYAWGDITGVVDVGGLIGQLDASDNTYSISNNFSMAKVVATDPEADQADGETGGIFGAFEGGVVVDSSHNYFDVTRTGQTACYSQALVGECTAVNASGSQPLYFIANTVNQPLANWNFNSLWRTHNDTPPTFGSNPDTDGIPTEVEEAAPNNGDANNDEIPDAEQSNVASYVNSATGKYTVLVVDDSCEIQSVQSKAETEVGNDAGYQYPAGLMQFTIACGTPGFEATITQYYYGTGGNYALRKYTPTAGYFDLSSASISDQTIAGQAVKVASYQVTDGSTLDTDGNEDGSITDPAGLAVQQQTQDAADLAGTGQSMPLYMILVGLLLGAVPAILVIEGRRL